jgi:hypothetical protein
MVLPRAARAALYSSCRITPLHPQLATGFVDQDEFRLGFTSPLINTGFLQYGWAVISLETITGLGNLCQAEAVCTPFTIALVPCP